MATAEPPNKRLFTEMSFSPDGKLQMDTSELRDILSDLLDEKLGYLKPLAENVTELKAEINKQKEVISKSQTKVHELEEGVNKLQLENKTLRQELGKLEQFQRKNNVRFMGIKENKGELLEVTIISMLNEFLAKTCHFDERTLERIHRLGPYKKGSTRVVLARFANYKDKITACQMRDKLKEKYGVTLVDDMPQVFQKAHDKLYPVFKAIQNVKQNPSTDDALVNSVKLRNGQLVINGQSFDTDSLDKLPEPLSIDKLFNISRNGITAFFRSYSALSNHHMCRFQVNDTVYSSMEKYLMHMKANLFGDADSAAATLVEDNPVRLKQLGKKIKNFKASVWLKESDSVLDKGLTAKFSQNENLGYFLRNTKEDTLVEANPFDSVFGVGLSLHNPAIFSAESWKGENKLGQALMRVRQYLKE